MGTIKLCGDPCTREANHKGGCSAPIIPPSDTDPHPNDCHCEWCERPDAAPPKEVPCIQKGCGLPSGHGGLHTNSPGYAPPSDAAPVAPSDKAKHAYMKAHAAVMGEWEVTDGWEEALDTGLRAAYAIDHPPLEQADAPGGPERVIPDDEIVGRGWVHIERMSGGHIWMNILGETYDLQVRWGKIVWTAQTGWKATAQKEGK